MNIIRGNYYPGIAPWVFAVEPKLRTHKKYWRIYKKHRYSAEQRGIEFKLTFSKWIEIWEESGQLDNRGREVGKYVMARFGDKGGYEVGNVKIVLSVENNREGSLGKPVPRERVERMAATKRGQKLPENHRKNISRGIKRAYKEGRR